MPRKRKRNENKKYVSKTNRLKMLGQIFCERLGRFIERVIDYCAELHLLVHDIVEAFYRNKFAIFMILLCIVIAVKKQTPVKKPRASLPRFPISLNVSSPPYDPWDIDPSIFLSPFLSNQDYGGDVSKYRSLEYDFYRDTCPHAEKIIRRVVQDAIKLKSDVAPQLLRLAFHDCFIEGCDGSILLDPGEGKDSEKDSPPNETVKGFEVINMIKSAVEEVCPGIVSCSDIVVLAARESVVSTGGPFYPIRTGRKDGNAAFRDTATDELPSPHSDLSETLAAFASRGFNERETVSLLGAHSIGVIHCNFFENRLHNFGGTNQPDPTLNADFLKILRSRCSNNTDDNSTSPAAEPTPSHRPNLSPLTPLSSLDTPLLSPSAPQPSFSNSVSSAPRALPPFFESSAPLSSTAPSASSGGSVSPSPTTKDHGSKTSLSGPTASSSKNSFRSSDPFSPSPSISASLKRLLMSSPDEQGMEMAYEGPGVDFGALYYRSLIHGRGILYADQQLMAGEETRLWVRVYASDVTLFRRDFAQAMMKLSELQVLTGSMGQVRHDCSRVA